MEFIENIDFKGFHILKQIARDPEISANKREAVDLSNRGFTDFAPILAMKLFPNIKRIDLSKNKIVTFTPRLFLEGVPQLEELDLSFNLISDLENLIVLGNMKHLTKLDISGNPIVKSHLRLRLIEYLLFPEKYKPFDAVQVLTATYHHVPSTAKITAESMKKEKNFQRIIERTTLELDTKFKNSSRISKYDNKKALIKLAYVPCPTPRKTRFPSLVYLNREIISIVDIRAILMTDDLDIIMPKEDELKQLMQSVYPDKKSHLTPQDKLPLQEKPHHKPKGGQPNFKVIEEQKSPDNSDKEEKTAAELKKHKYFVERYKKRVERQNDEAYKAAMLKAIDQNESNDLKALAKKDEIEKRVKDTNLWEKPIDLNHRDAEFAISMKDYKKMLVEHDENRRTQIEQKKKKKKLRLMKLIQKTNKKFSLNEDDSYHSIDSDPELKKIYKIKKKKKPKLDLDPDEEVIFAKSSETSVSEGHSDENLNAEDLFTTEDIGSALDELQDETPRESKPEPQPKKKDYRLGSSFREDIKIHPHAIQSPLSKDNSMRLSVLKTGSQDLETETKKSPEKVVLPKTIYYYVDDEKVLPNLGLPLIIQKPKRKVDTHFNFLPSKLEASSPLLLSNPNIKNEFGTRESLSQNLEMPDHFQETRDKQNIENDPLRSKVDYFIIYLEPSSIVQDFQDKQKYLLSENELIEALSDKQEKPQKKQTFAINLNQQSDNSLDLSTSHLKHEGDYIIENEKKTERAPLSSRFEKVHTTAEPKAKYFIALPEKTGNTPGVPTIPEQTTAASGDRMITQTSEGQKNSIHPIPSKTVTKFSAVEGYPISPKAQVTSISCNVFNLSPQSVNMPNPQKKSSYLKKRAQQLKQIETKSFNINNKIFFNHRKVNNSQSQSQLSTGMTPSSAGGPSSPAKKQFRIFSRTQMKRNEYFGSMFRADTTKNETKNDSYTKGMLNYSPYYLTSRPTTKALETKVPISPRPMTYGNDRNSKSLKKFESIGIKIDDDSRLNQINKQEKISLNVDKLLPGPKEGVPEHQQQKILQTRGEKYQKLVETAKMIEDTNESIERAKKLNRNADPIVTATTVTKKPITYEQLTEFLRQIEKRDYLKFEDNRDIRELIYLVNDYTHDGEVKLNRLDIEQKLRELNQEMYVEGDALTKRVDETNRFNKYLEILENLDIHREQHHAKYLEKIEKEEVQRAENNAVLAAHYMKLKKYCGEDLIKKHFKGNSNILSGIPQPITRYEPPYKPRNKKVHTYLGKHEFKTVADKFEYLKEVKSKQPQGNPHQRPIDPIVQQEEEKISRIKKFVPQPMLGFEEITEIQLRKINEEFQKNDNTVLSPEEKVMKYAEQFKVSADKTQDLKYKVDKYIREGSERITKFIEDQIKQNELIHNEKELFRDYVKLLVDDKL